MSTTLISQIPFSFSVSGSSDGNSLPRYPDSGGYPNGGSNAISWSMNLIVENGSAVTEQIFPGDFCANSPGSLPTPGFVDDDTQLITFVESVDTINADTVGAVITVTTRWEAMAVSESGFGLPHYDHVLSGNFTVLVESDIPLTVHAFDNTFGGFSMGWTGFDARIVEWDPVPKFSENPGVDPEVALDSSAYTTDFFDYPDSSQWSETFALIINDDENPPEPEPTEEDRKLTVWGFKQDGHRHFVFRLGNSSTLVYDRTTGQWAEWRTEGLTVWRAHLGLNWQGIATTTLSAGTAWNVIGGDDRTGILWTVDPTYSRDTDDDGVEVNFTRQLIGMYPMRMREGQQCGGFYVIGDLGDPALTAPDITLKTSDNDGRDWVNHVPVSVTPDDDGQEIAWIGLGLITNPGRLFLLEDQGAFARISSMDMR